MSTISDRTPVVIGVGEASETLGAPGYQGLSPADLAARAAAAACDDAASVAALAPHIDTIASIRQFEISHGAAVAPFGCSNNFPRSVAKRIGADPRRAILEITGGQGPQHLINEACETIARGESDLFLAVGSEAISTMRDLQAREVPTDWSETVEGSLEDRGYGLDGLLTAHFAQHGMGAPMLYYALFEHARRARLGLSKADYQIAMGRLFEPFTRVAAGNRHAMAPTVRTAEELSTPTPRNRMVADPYTRFLVSRDQANQGAAVIVASVAMARRLGVPESKWVYLKGYADAKERTNIDRQDLSKGPASVLAIRRALDAAAVAPSDLTRIDLYSCFPIAVFNICDGIGFSPDDPRGLTVTGGLPFFGGAGNNYSMHAIAEMVQALRAERPGATGLVAANGGFLSKYSVGVYTTAPTPFVACDSKPLQAEVDAWPAVPSVERAEGAAVVETYTVDYGRPDAPRGIVVGRLAADGARFVAVTPRGDQATVAEMIDGDPIGRAIAVRPGERAGNVFTFAG
jgi:acetyl-CoA C-acetyltransferase